MPNEVIYCWPSHWLEAARKTGFADRQKDGSYIFINEKLRDMLGEFAQAIQDTQREKLAELMERQHTWITNVASSNLIRNS